jgi:hypothetical protein
MGKAAVALLVSQIENGAVYPEELLFEPELVVRGSTGRVAVVTSPEETSPVAASPVVSSPEVSSPVVTSPVVTSPVAASPVVTSPVVTS